MAGSLKARINGELLVVGRPGPPGNPGANGTDGVDGADGADGVGVPAGGADGQVLAKGSAADYDTQWIDPPAGGGGGGGSALLGSAEKNTTTSSVLSTTSTSPVAVDAALAVTFTAPTSGAVVLKFGGAANIAGTANFMAWCALDGGSLVAGTERAVIGTNGSPGRPHYEVRKTGLTPGASYTWSWGYRGMSAGTSTLYYGGATEGASINYGPLTMEVWSG